MSIRGAPALQTSITSGIGLPPCPDCGAPRRPVTDGLLALVFGPAVPGDLRVLMQLCERCRSRQWPRKMLAYAHEGKE